MPTGMFPFISKEFAVGLHEKRSTLVSKYILVHPGERKPVSVSHASLTFWALTNGFLITSNGQTIIFKLPSNFWPIVSDLWAL